MQTFTGTPPKMTQGPRTTSAESVHGNVSQKTAYEQVMEMFIRDEAINSVELHQAKSESTPARNEIVKEKGADWRSCGQVKGTVKAVPG